MRSASLKFQFIAFLVAALSLVATSSSSWAVTVPFVEDFTNNNAGWANFNSSGFATYNATGGPDGGAYISGPRTLTGLTPGNTAIALRARFDDPWNSSGDAFAGNWQFAGARKLSAWVQHDIPTPVNFFVRAAGQANFPGHIYVEGLGTDANTWKFVQPNTWTQVFFDMSKFSTQLLNSEGGTWNGVFGPPNGVGHVQLGVIVPAGYSADTTTFNISVDKVSLSTPEPTSAILAVVGIIGFVATTRRRRSGCLQLK